MALQTILAKSVPERTLLEHTIDCLEVFEKVLSWKRALITKVASQYQIDQDELIKRLFITVAFHDIGKATEQFQFKVRSTPFKGLESHPLSSIPIVFSILKDNPLFEIHGTGYYPEILSIISHHNKLYKDVYSGYNNMHANYAVNEYFIQFFDLINQWAKKLRLPVWKDLTFNEKAIKNAEAYHLFYDKVFDQIVSADYTNDFERQKVRNIFILFKSVLHYSDWIASAGLSDYKYAQQESIESLTIKMQSNVPAFKSWSAFQKKAALSQKNLLVQISTGQGKTEAAILWAVNQNKNQKILFLLPTMVTTNKMWRRLQTFFDKEDVGLSHGAAQYVLKQQEEDFDSTQFRQQYLYNRTFFKPITVATVDQLIYSFFNWGYWVLTGASSYNAKIVIDEIHVYDAYTFGLILRIIKIIKPFNSQFAIMSASLPNVLQAEIRKILPDYDLIQEPALDEKQRHFIKVTNDVIEQQVNEILKDYNAKRKVLVICNTIGKARQVYDLLTETSPNNKMLYHSQFILKDKKLKEDELENITGVDGGFIAICTQIVEVSLDIDFDVLFTENAPIDAIIQRLGRVNRKGEIAKRRPGELFGKVVITKESDASRKYIYADAAAIMQSTFYHLEELADQLEGNLKERDFKAIVENVYTHENLGVGYFKKIEEAERLIDHLWEKLLKGVYTLSVEEKSLNEISSREVDFITVECVLTIHNHVWDFANLLNEKKFETVKEYTVKIPYHVVKKFHGRKISEVSDIYLIDLAYNKDNGISYNQAINDRLM